MTYVRVKQLSARPAGKMGGTTDIMLRPFADGAFLFYIKIKMSCQWQKIDFLHGTPRENPFTRFTK